MKKSILAAIAVTLSFSALAAPLLDSPSDDLYVAKRAIERELGRRTDPGKGKPIRLDQPSGVQPSDAEQAALKAVFGTEQPLTIQRTGTVGKTTNYSAALPAHEYRVGEARTTWQGATWQHSVTGNLIDTDFRWPGLDFHGQDFIGSIQTVTARNRQTRGASTHKLQMQVESVYLQETKGAGSAHADGIELREEITQKKQKLDAHVAFSTRRISFGNGVVLDDLHLDLNMRDLNASLWQQLTEVTEDDHDAAFRALMKQLLMQGARLDLNDISVRFGGGTMRLRGTIGMPGVTLAQLATVKGALNAVEAHLTVELPLTTLRSFAMVATHHTLQSAGAQVLDQPAEDTYSAMLGKILADGYARLEPDRLVAVIDVKRGQISINGRAQPFTLAQLLAMLNKQPQRTPAPEQDQSPPVALLWRDRALDTVLLFANNGDWHAKRELCQRYAQTGDAEQAARWCDKAKIPVAERTAGPWETPPDLKDGTLHLSAPAGRYSTNHFRFDASKTRSLRIKLGNPQTHQTWAAGMIICVTAELPSDRACLSLSKYGGVDDMRAASRLYSADNQPMGADHILEYQAKVGVPLQLTIHVDDKQVHFRWGDKELVEDVAFPAEAISLTCSTADCDFSFD